MVDRLGHCNAMYGLTRKDVVRRTRLLGSCFGADIVLLAELVLYGAFWEVPEFLFYRRFHAAAHSRMTTIEQFKGVWGTQDRGRGYFYTWGPLWEATPSAPPPPPLAPEQSTV